MIVLTGHIQFDSIILNVEFSSMIKSYVSAIGFVLTFKSHKIKQ